MGENGRMHDKSGVIDAAPDGEGAKTRTRPIFISGRQHSGNTVAAVVFDMAPECYVVNVEGWFFEHRGILDRMKDPAKRAGHLVGVLRLEDTELADRTRRALIDWHRQRPAASSIDLYRRAIELVTADSDKRLWVRRATSYIFYADEILSLMPEARIIYLLRNPYDVCASLKRRDRRVDRFGAMVIGWNRGLRIALRLREAHPDRVLIVRYEDMASRPVETFRAVFDFAGVPFREAYLDVPHVNRSEAKQTRTSETRGLNASRVYYYPGVLTGPEVAAVDMLVWKEKLDEYYPDLPHSGERRGLPCGLAAVGLVCLSPLRFVAHQLRLFIRQNSAWRSRRLLRRFGTVFRGR